MAATRDKLALVRALDDLADYPAVLLPGSGGWEVVFPNLAGLTAWGQSKEMARFNGVEALTFELGRIIAGGDVPPRPSDPERLIPGDDEPAGSELVMLSPDKAVLRARLGLKKSEKGNPLGATLGRLGRN